MILLDCWMLIKSLLSPYYAINPWVLALHFKDLYFINKGIDLHFINFVIDEGLAGETWWHTEFLLNYKVYRPFYSEIHWLKKKIQWKYLWKKWNPENILQYFALDSSEETPFYWKAIVKDSKYKNIPTISFHFLWNKQMYYKRPLNASTWRTKDLPKEKRSSKVQFLNPVYAQIRKIYFTDLEIVVSRYQHLWNDKQSSFL